jgi:maleylacetoacetate isomerase
VKLYGYFRSSAAYRVRIALNLKHIDADHVSIHLRDDDQKQSAYLAMNPQGLVPALELDDGTLLTQSLAIIEYVDAVRPVPRLIPPDPAMAAKVRAISLAIACDIHPLNNLRVLTYLKDVLKEPQEAIDSWYRHWLLEGGLNAVEEMISGGNFCIGDSPTLADVCLIPQVFNARRFNISIDHLPRINKVNATCANIEAFAAAHPSRQPDAQ